jgi:hypothetical protein
MAMSPARLCRVSVRASGGGVRGGAVHVNRRYAEQTGGDWSAEQEPLEAFGYAAELSPQTADLARPAALALGTHGAGRRRSAIPPHPPPAGPRRHAPR